MATTETVESVETVPVPIPDTANPELEAAPLSLEDTDTVPEGKRPKPTPTPTPKREALKPLAERNPLAGVDSEEHQNWRDYFLSLAGQSAFRIEVHRKKPDTIRYKNRNIDCSGHLATYEEMIDEEFIRERHGGGTLFLRFMVPNAKGGGYKYGAGKQIKIAGDPKIEDKWLNADDTAAAPQQTSDPATKEFVGFLAKEVERKERKLDDLANRSALDPTLIALITEPLKQQNAMLAQQLEAMRKELAESRNAPAKESKGDEFRDKMLDRMMDGESARIAAIRANHESELRQAKESHLAEVKRLEDRHDRAMADLRAQHDRELAQAKSMQDIALASVNQGAQLAKAMLEQTVARLEADNRRYEKELDELRAKKDKPLVEQLKEIDAIKKLVAPEKDEDGDDDKKSPWVQGIEALGIGNVLQGVAGKLLAGAEPQPAAQPQPALPPPGTRFRGPDGRPYLMTPNGPLPIKPKQVAAPPAPPRTRTEVQVNPETGEPQEVEVPITVPAVVIPPDKLGLVKQMLEGAFNAGTDPKAVAQTARTMAPGAIPVITQAIGTQGVDAFLDQMAAFDGNSPLAQQEGRNFLRKVAKALMGE